MKYERKLSHTIYDTKQHFCWITKYRYDVLRGEKAIRCREIIKEVCKKNEVEIIQGHVRPNHIHIVVSRPPYLSESKLMKYIKGKSGRKMLQEYSGLRRIYYGGSLWARGYYCATSGNVTDEMLIEYVKNQDKEDLDEEKFKISG